MISFFKSILKACVTYVLKEVEDFSVHFRTKLQFYVPDLASKIRCQDTLNLF